jgi:hypothetical protein
MPDVGELSLESFADRLGEPFRIHTTDARVVDVSLAEASALGDPFVPGGRAPFSLVFRGPAEQILPQTTYPVEHDALGSFELFLVPLKPDGGGARYEAVFT